MTETSRNEAASPFERRPGGDQVELIDLLRILWKWKYLIVGGTLACALVALVSSMLEPPTYQATTTLRVVEPKMEDATETSTSVAQFEALVESRSLVARLLEELELDGPPHEIHPLNFLGGNLEVEPVAGTNLLDATISLGDPDLAARAANLLAELAVAKVREINESDTDAIRALIKEQLDEARSRLEESEQQLLDYRSEAQLELLRAETNSLVGQKGRLVDLLIQIEAQRARLARAEEELTSRERVLTVRRSIDDETALMEAARSEGRTGSELLRLELNDEFINPVYQNLEQQIANTRTSLAGLEEERRELVDELGLDRSEIEELTRLYEREAALSRLEAEHSLAEAIYADLLSRYERARIEAASRSAQLEIVDPAFAPPGPVSPGTRSKVLLGAALGLMLATGAAFLVEYVGTEGG